MQRKYSPKRNRDLLAKELEVRYGEPLAERLWRMHWTEQLPMLQMANRLGTSRGTVTRLMDDYRIPHRTVGEDTKRRLDNMTPDERKQITKAANAAMRGRKQPPEERAKRARTLQDICKMSKPEMAMLRALRSASLEPVPQYAVHIFNIDLAFPAQKVAVEVDGGNWHHSATHLRCQENKERYLRPRGWTILRCRYSKGKWHPGKESFVTSVSELVNSRACTHPR